MKAKWGTPNRMKTYEEVEPIFVAADTNNLEMLKSLVQSGADINKKSLWREESLLHRAVKYHNIPFFDYLLSLSDIDLNQCNKEGNTPLLSLASDSSFNAHMFHKLLSNGAKSDARNKSGDTFLHLAIKHETQLFDCCGVLMRYNGDLIDMQNDDGETPLYVSMEYRTHQWTHVLIYHGANATIPRKNGILPIAANFDYIYAPSPENDETTFMRNAIYDLTFDDLITEYDFSLAMIIMAMRLDHQLFRKILNLTRNVTYTNSNLHELHSNLALIKSANFRLFMDKFRYVIDDMLDNSDEFLPEFCETYRIEKIDFVEILNAFFDHGYSQKLVQTCTESYSVIIALIHKLVISREEHVTDFTMETATGFICHLLSYGMKYMTSDDLDFVYQHFGDCQLFWILLAMDFDVKTRPENEFLNNKRPAMAALIYNPKIKLEEILDNPEGYDLESALDYFANHRLYECVDKIQVKRQFPLLVELARNVARRFIVERYKIADFKTFSRVTTRLPIGGENLKILMYQTKIYNQ